MKILDLKQGTPEWLEVRKSYFCASDAAAMMGASKYETRDELLHRIATGITKDIDPNTQRLFDRGHAAEAAARPVIEQAIGEDLFPCVGADGLYLASFDGITMDESKIFEHKLWSEILAQQVIAQDLEPHYYWQLEHQLMVSGAEVAYFMTSEGPNREWMEYYPQPGRREALIAGWEQFKRDLASYQPVEKKSEAVGVKPDSMPALFVEVTGSLTTASNLEEYRKGAELLIGSIKTDLQTDQDFANAEAAVKWLGEAEKKIDAHIENVMARAGDLNALVTTLRDVQQNLMRTKRLALSKQVDAQKANRRNQIIADAQAAFAVWMDDVNAEFSSVRINTVKPDFAGAIKGKRSFDAMISACNDLLAQSKIQVTEIAARYRKNLSALAKHPDHAGLFHDIQALVQMDHDHLCLLIDNRINEHKAKDGKDGARCAEQDGRAAGVNMEQVFQTDFGPDGNCMSACLATLFELPISAVPNFYHVAGHDPEKWWNAISDWLRPHGYGLLIATVTSEYLARLDGALIVGGTSPRGVQHAVIYVDGKLWHDPHPDGGGVTDPLDVTVIYPLHGFPHPAAGGVI